MNSNENNYTQMKIGEIVQNSLQKIKQYCETIDTNEINNLLNFDYSKQVFKLSYPFFIESKNINEQDPKKQARRFYKNEYMICGKRVRATNDWYIKNKNKFINYIKTIENKNSQNDCEINKIDYPENATPTDNLHNVLLEHDSTAGLPEKNNFTYEEDLRKSLILQIESLFPDYKIYGNNEGVEYVIDGKRIDLLLENKTEKQLLAIELKPGETDYKTFGQISMYLGLLSKHFPEIPKENITGIIIAGKIDETLKSACLTSDKIKLMEYTMIVSLKEIL